MKKITLLVVAMLFGSLTAFAQFSFPAEGPELVTAGTPTTLGINDAGNAAGATAGTYVTFIVTADWAEGAGGPWSSEAELQLTTTAGTVDIDPPTTGAASSGDPTTLTFEGSFVAPYDPSVDGFLEITLGQSFAGSDATWSNIVVQIIPPPACGDPENLSATPTDVAVTISWDAPTFGTPTGYNWEVQPDGVAQGTPGALASGTTAGTSVTTGNVLTASTPYEVYVQTDCGVDGTSAYVTTGFTTTALPPPANDNFANAQPIDCSTTNLTGSTANATLDEDDAPDGGGADMDAPNVWFSYDSAVEGAGDITVDLCPSTYDTSVLVYTGTSGNLTFVAGNDDNNGVCGQCCQSNVTFVANGTDVYYIAVEGFNFTSTGDFDMTVSCVAPTPPPPNDQCINAEPLTLTVTATGTTVGATTDAGDPPTCDTFGQIADVWYSVNLTLSSNNLSIVTTITDTSDQANVAVYTDCDGAAGNSVGCIDGNGGETLTVNNLPAGLYYVRVWSDGNAPPSSGRTEGGFTVTADATLSTGSVEDANAFTYYPNPVKGELLLNAQKDIQDVQVFNVLGQEVLRVSPNNADTAIDMNGLSNGAYFVRVTIDNVTETVRIIKQ